MTPLVAAVAILAAILVVLAVGCWWQTRRLYRRPTVDRFTYWAHHATPGEVCYRLAVIEWHTARDDHPAGGTT